MKLFLQKYWLEVIAVFPFFLVFRIMEPLLFLFGDASREVKNLQLIFHESLELSKSSSSIAREAETAAKVSRTRAITSMFRVLGRSPRLLKAAKFYEKPTKKK